MPLVLDPEVFDVIKDEVHFMGELAKHVELEKGDKKILPEGEKIVETESGKFGVDGDRESRLIRMALARLLEELVPTNYRARQWGSLRRVRMSDDSYRWLCEGCAKRGH